MEIEKSYKVLDEVLIRIKDRATPVIGKIKDIQEERNSFTYDKYLFPEDTQNGRQDHHGNHEVFKTGIIEKGSLSQIEKKVQLIKMKDFYKKDLVEIEEKSIYVVRQFYDINSNTFNPDPLGSCKCRKVVNPDYGDGLVWCEDCDRYYHSDCIPDDHTSCDQCDTYLTRELYGRGSGLNRERRPSLEGETIPLKKLQSGYNVQVAKMIVQTIVKDAGPKPSNSRIILNPSSRPHDGSAANSRKTYKNINEERFQKLNRAIEKYKQSNPTRGLSNYDKDRSLAKENLFCSLMYGIKELEEKWDDNTFVVDNEKEELIRRLNESQHYDHAKLLALQFEACMNQEYNRNDKTRIDPQYKEKFRVIIANLKDESNHELRYKFLTGLITPAQLTKITEIELLNSEKRQERLEREKQYIKEHTLQEAKEIIAKSHKGEAIITKEEKKEDEPTFLDNDSNVDRDNVLSEQDMVFEKRMSSDLFASEDILARHKVKKTQSLNSALTQSKPLKKASAGNQITLQDLTTLESQTYIDVELKNQLEYYLNEKAVNRYIERLRQFPEDLSNRFITNFKKNT